MTICATFNSADGDFNQKYSLPSLKVKKIIHFLAGVSKIYLILFLISPETVHYKALRVSLLLTAGLWMPLN